MPEQLVVLYLTDNDLEDAKQRAISLAAEYPGQVITIAKNMGHVAASPAHRISDTSLILPIEMRMHPQPEVAL